MNFLRDFTCTVVGVFRISASRGLALVWSSVFVPAKSLLAALLETIYSPAFRFVDCQLCK